MKTPLRNGSNGFFKAMETSRTMVRLCCFGIAMSAIGGAAAAADWQAIPEVDFAALSPDDFTVEELGGIDSVHSEKGILYYLAHFKRVADAVRQDEPNRGFIDIQIWRSRETNRPFNARIMESCLSLIWFYTADRKWNPYYGHPAVRQRLEAALEYWLSLQHTDGRFSEYGPQKWNLAATAFATKFMGEGLLLLADGPPIDKDLHRRVIAAQRKAIMATLTRSDLWTHGTIFTNQYENVWCGTLAYLILQPQDEEMRRQFTRKFAESEKAFQSPAGYHYESTGPDWGYNFGTHHSNIRMAWHLARQMNLPGIARRLERDHQLWIEWLSYNAVPEPDGSAFILNRAIETRTSMDRFRRLDTPLAETVEPARAFATSRQEYEERLTQAKTKTIEIWPDVRKLPAANFSAYSPYAFLHLRHPNYYPTEAERDAARQKLPCLASERFIHQRTDDRTPLVLTCVRRPSYYAVFNTGPGRGGHRYGLGLLWHPKAGAFFQQQNQRVSTPPWGTRVGDADVMESAKMDAEYRLDGKPFKPQTGNRTMDGRMLAVRYALGEKGHKTVTFEEDRIVVKVEHPGVFTEEIPLLAREGDKVVRSDNVFAVSRNGITLEITVDGAADIAVNRHHARVSARDALSYTIRIIQETR